jgi:hypothetical protein
MSLSDLFSMRNVSGRSCKENHTFRAQELFFNHAAYEIMWKNIVEPGRPQMTWRIGILCCIPKAIDTNSECVTLVAFPRH